MLLPILPLLLILWIACSDAEHQAESYLKYYNVEAHVRLARASLTKAGVTSTSDRLAVMLLFTHALRDEHYGPCFRCSFLSMQANINLQGATKADFFIFVRPEVVDEMSKLSWIKSGKNLHILTVDPEDDRNWKVPTWLRPSSNWSQGWPEDYRLMGHWRLCFSFPFARQLQYKYMLQTDTDVYINEPITVDLVAEARLNNYYLTNRNWTFLEVRRFYKGLPELAQYWLNTRTHLDGQHITVENASSAGIKGPIFKHCTPQDRSGLRTGTTRDARVPGFSGWDAECIAGHFSIFSLDWWFSWEVQDFVQLVLRTGGHIEQRWVDVATQSMINHLFVSEERFYTHPWDISHGHGVDTCLKAMLCGKDWLV